MKKLILLTILVVFAFAGNVMAFPTPPPYRTLDAILSGSPYLVNSAPIAGLGHCGQDAVYLTDLTPPETAVATILLEAAGFANVNQFGIYDYKGAGVAPLASEELIVFQGSDSPGMSATIEFDLINGIAWYDRDNDGIKDAGETASVGTTFGFYLISPDGPSTFYTDSLLNPDTTVTEHGIIFDTVGISGAITGDPDVVVAFEDLLAHHSDWDFTDMVVGVTDVAPIPAPGAVLLGGIGVCLVGWLRRRRSL